MQTLENLPHPKSLTGICTTQFCKFHTFSQRDKNHATKIK